MTKEWMVFIMLNWQKNFRFFGVLLLFCLFVEPVQSKDYSAKVSGVSIETESNEKWLKLNANLNFRLSPVAKEALQKGIDLTWTILIKIEQEKLFWNVVVEERKIKVKIKHHTLLSLYGVDYNGVNDMFSTLSAALNAVSKIRHLAIVDKQLIRPDNKYQVAVKVLFNREALPIPLRPISYFDSQWALSSQWVVWQLQK